MVNKLRRFVLKSEFRRINILIALPLIFILLFSVWFMFTYRKPKDFQTQTGVISEFKEFEEQWYHDVLPGGQGGSFFNVRFEDETFFKATGICYDYIDKALFDDIRVGEEITITYFEPWTGPKRIFGIEYNGKTYLVLDEVLKEYEDNDIIANIVGLTVIAVSITAAVVLFILNYKKKRKR